MREERSYARYFLSKLFNLNKLSFDSMRKGRNLLDWADEHSGRLFGFNDKNESYDRVVKDELKKWIDKVNLNDNERIHNGTVNKKLEVITETFQLLREEKEILRIVLLCHEYESVKELLYELTGISDINKIFISSAANIKIKNIENIIANKNSILMNGLLEYWRGDISMSDVLERIYQSPCRNADEIRKQIVDEKANTHLKRSDFEYVAEQYDYIVKILKASLEKQEKGINILLYGTPGTGKTELAKAVCKEVNASLYMLQENSKEDKKKERLRELVLAQDLCKFAKNTALMFDEAEDAFTNSIFYESGSSKLFMNRLLEKNATPVIWISNNIRSMDKAYLRRFTYALEVPTPSVTARQNIWLNVAKTYKLKLSADQAKQYAKNYVVPPAFVDSAIKSAKLINDINAIDTTMQSLHKSITGKEITIKKEKKIEFNTDILNTSEDLKALKDRIVTNNIERFSLCLYGAAGTGKSEYARYLAEQMGLEVIHKRASDLLSMYVGEAEKNIAKAFKKARDEKALLIFDEADSFLQDRTNAQRSWEVSQVNEMLTWMECHPYPFICTTNLMTKLDKASLRRFTFKVKYDYMTNEQVVIACKHFLGLQATLEDVQILNYLAPGDFMVVKNKVDILGITDKSEMIKMLLEEQDVKEIAQVKVIGF